MQTWELCIVIPSSDQEDTLTLGNPDIRVAMIPCKDSVEKTQAMLDNMAGEGWKLISFREGTVYKFKRLKRTP